MLGVIYAFFSEIYANIKVTKTECKSNSHYITALMPQTSKYTELLQWDYQLMQLFILCFYFMFVPCIFSIKILLLKSN
jgi:hypothetical protein